METFEEYQKHFFQFCKPSPDNLERCERDFRQYLINEEDRKYFQPLDDNTASHQTIALRRLGFMDSPDVLFYFLTIPSFTSDSLLQLYHVGESFYISVTTSTKSIVNETGETKMDLALKNVHALVNDETGGKLLGLLGKYIQSARPKKGNLFQLDGSMHVLSILLNGQRKTVLHFSENTESVPGRIVALLKKIIERIDYLDEETVIEINEEIDTLMSF